MAVEVLRGDDFLDANSLRFPTVVKIDVEGHEYQVLYGLARTLSRPECRLLICEIHPEHLSPHVTVERIARLSEVFGFTGHELRPRDGELQLVAFRSI